jgi:antirestriction protein ArdC
VQQLPYQTITDHIVAALEKGVRPWQQPWKAVAWTAGRVLLPLPRNGVAYRGINVINLWMTALDRGFRATNLP